jgi:hypothetical protein
MGEAHVRAKEEFNRLWAEAFQSAGRTLDCVADGRRALFFYPTAGYWLTGEQHQALRLCAPSTEYYAAQVELDDPPFRGRGPNEAATPVVARQLGQGAPGHPAEWFVNFQWAMVGEEWGVLIDLDEYAMVSASPDVAASLCSAYPFNRDRVRLLEDHERWGPRSELGAIAEWLRAH